MANRHIVQYEEAKDAVKGEVPKRAYFSDLISIILINLNERDSINRIKNNPDGTNGNRILQLSGIANKQVESDLLASRSRVNTLDTPLYAQDVNRIIDNTEDLVNTIGTPKTEIQIIDCPFWRNWYMVPSDYVPSGSTTGGDNYTPITVTSISSTVTNATTSKKVKVVGYSGLTAAEIKGIVGVEVNPFGAITPASISYTYGDSTITFNILAFFSFAVFDSSGATQETKTQTVIVLNSAAADLPDSFSDLKFQFTGADSEITVLKSNFSDVGTSAKCYAEVAPYDGILSTPTNTPVTFNLAIEADDEMAVATPFRQCMLTYDATKPDTECENRTITAGYNPKGQTGVNKVQVCTNTKRKVEVITTTTEVQWNRPNATADRSNGDISASSYTYSGHGNQESWAYYAVDGDPNSAWWAGASTAWWNWYLPDKIKLTGLIITNYNGTIRGRCYTSSNKTTPIGNEFTISGAGTRFTVTGIPTTGIEITSIYIDIITSSGRPGFRNIEFIASQQSTKAISIKNVERGDVVYASKFTEIATYLRSVSAGLDSYKDWWNDSGYCNRTCQVQCQRACMLACQGCHSNTCHNQNCGLS